MKGQYSEQEVMMLSSGMRLLKERERSLLTMVDDMGKEEIQYFIRKYNRLVLKLEKEL